MQNDLAVGRLELSPLARATLDRLRITALAELAELTPHDLLGAIYAAAGREDRALPVMSELRRAIGDHGLSLRAIDVVRSEAGAGGPPLPGYVAAGSFTCAGALRIADPRFLALPHDAAAQEASMVRVGDPTSVGTRCLDLFALSVPSGTWDAYVRRYQASGAFPTRPVRVCVQRRGAGPLALHRIGELFLPDQCVVITDAAEVATLRPFLPHDMVAWGRGLASFVEAAVDDRRQPCPPGTGYELSAYADAAGEIGRIEVTAYAGEDPYGG